jgi:hypothetical protein
MINVSRDDIVAPPRGTVWSLSGSEGVVMHADDATALVGGAMDRSELLPVLHAVDRLRLVRTTLDSKSSSSGRRRLSFRFGNEYLIQT